MRIFCDFLLSLITGDRDVLLKLVTISTGKLHSISPYKNSNVEQYLANAKMKSEYSLLHLTSDESRGNFLATIKKLND